MLQTFYNATYKNTVTFYCLKLYDDILTQSQCVLKTKYYKVFPEFPVI